MLGVALFSVIGFGTCSSIMLVINKVALTNMAAPAFILFLQCFLTAVAVLTVSAARRIQLDNLEDKSLWLAYLPVSVGFLATLYSNSKALQYVNVETFIVCRNSTPVVISILDYLLLGRELPSARSAGCILMMALGAVGYVITDAAFVIDGYLWLAFWLSAFVFDQIYIKHVVESIELESTWSRVMLTNSWSSAGLLAMVICKPSEWYNFGTADAWTPQAMTSVGGSCFVAVFISYFSFLARKELSATAFTILGNSCKIFSVILNVAIWDKHATPVGLVMLGVTLAAAAFYTQAPMRADKAKVHAEQPDMEVETDPLVKQIQVQQYRLAAGMENSAENGEVEQDVAQLQKPPSES